MVILPPIKLSVERHLVRLPTPFPGNSDGQALAEPARGTIFLFLNQKTNNPPPPPITTKPVKK